jgi:site-specific recombinase XerD
MALSRELADHLRQFIEWKAMIDQPTDAEEPLFVGERGPLTAQGLQLIWKRAIERAGLPKELSIHSARHTIAVALLKKTGNLRLVQKQLGHTDPAVTANLYADVAFEDMQESLNGLYGVDVDSAKDQ